MEAHDFSGIVLYYYYVSYTIWRHMSSVILVLLDANVVQIDLDRGQYASYLWMCTE